jgi:hypothetical protein
MGKFDYSQTDYVDVAGRIRAFREAYPSGSLQPADLTRPYTIEVIGDQIYIVVVAAAYRTPEDIRPGVGMAYESFPGKTPYTRGSELQNAETSAWGRAIVAALAGDTKKGVASADEVRNRQAEREYPETVVRAFPEPGNDPSSVRAAISAAGLAQGMSVAEITEDFLGWSEGSPITTDDTAMLLEYLANLTKVST